MPETIKLAILSFICSNAVTGTPARLSFTSLTKAIHVPKAELDKFLTELNRERFVSQYAKKGVDGFNVVMNQKGEDAVQDGSLP